MTVRAILDLKGRDVTTIAPDKTLWRRRFTPVAT